MHEIKATLGKIPRGNLEPINFCVSVCVCGVCQSKGSLVGGRQDSDVKHDTVTAGKFTLPPPSAHSLPLSLSLTLLPPQGSCSGWHVANLAKICRLSAFQSVHAACMHVLCVIFLLA